MELNQLFYKYLQNKMVISVCFINSGAVRAICHNCMRMPISFIREICSFNPFQKHIDHFNGTLVSSLNYTQKMS